MITASQSLFVQFMLTTVGASALIGAMVYTNSLINNVKVWSFFGFYFAYAYQRIEQ